MSIFATVIIIRSKVISFLQQKKLIHAERVKSPITKLADELFFFLDSSVHSTSI